MHQLRITAEVASDHTVLLTLPPSVPIGPTEVVVFYELATSSSPTGNNGPKVLAALDAVVSATAGLWDGMSEEIQEARDEWDRD